MSVIEQLAKDQGFEFMGTCSAKELTARQEVRAMCAANTCQMYEHSWACPPACGEIEDFQRQMREFDHCLVVQTVADMEDDFDVEAMQEAGDLQKERVLNLVEAIDEAGLSASTMTLSAGTCTLCKECTYPDAPCRRPDQMHHSIEGYGFVVSDLAKEAGIPYMNGKNTVTFFGAVLYGK